MYRLVTLVGLCAVFSLAQARAEPTTVCTMVADAATGETILQEGACNTSVTPASTFKIAISLMGFDAGFLKDAKSPSLPFRDGYVDWSPKWKSTTDPAKWMKDSVVWYSQQITAALGEETFRRYVEAFGYGNEDVSGDAGKDNGITNAWLSSSLQIYPAEQLEFLARLVRRELPVSAHAYEMTSKLTDIGIQPSGWHVHGKTGAGASQTPNGTIIRGKPVGWFVGWATKDDRTVVFARLNKSDERPDIPPGFTARDSVLVDLFASPGGL